MSDTIQIPDNQRAPHDVDSNSQTAPRLKKLAELRALGIDPYPYSYDPTAHADELQRKYEGLALDTYTEDKVRVAGRVRAVRNGGMFIDLADTTGRIQIYSDLKTLDGRTAKILELIDIGDMIGVEGTIRRTRRGELTVALQDLTVLSKALLPLPEKYHGLVDIETRQRQRYLDLIMNDESRAVFRKRSRIISEVRGEMIDRGFLEVETPMLHQIAGGASARPFITHHNALDIDLYLRIAPELHLKRLIVGQLSDRVFEINRCFRNEGISPRHNPEFTTLEAYQAFGDYNDMLELAEAIVTRACLAVNGSLKIKFGERELDLTRPWRRETMTELVREATGVDFLDVKTAEEARERCKALGLAVTGKENWGQAVELVFGEKVEKSLVQPTHATEHPRDISPLAKGHRTDPRLTERFETFINGWEVANAFSELTDPQDQFTRFEAQTAQKDAGDVEAQSMDRDFVRALEYGLVPTGGLGIGIDRLTMLLTDSASIRDVILFPTHRPQN
ncbi:MAG: lysine--tRNA ligase [Parvibaculaceae bacterium]|nr:lysine--tRNA ligase [Parvibaculaceae bacterium]